MYAPIRIRYLSGIEIEQRPVNSDLRNIQRVCSCQEANFAKGAEEEIVGAARHIDTVVELRDS